jgi:S1-C subfamily serine protease
MHHTSRRGPAPRQGRRRQSRFEPAQVGIEAAPTKTAVRITALREGSVFARAGLRLGDQVVEFDGQEVRSTDHFRRYLRRHVARDAYSELRIRRDGHWIDVLLPPLR